MAKKYSYGKKTKEIIRKLKKGIRYREQKGQSFGDLLGQIAEHELSPQKIASLAKKEKGKYTKLDKYSANLFKDKEAKKKEIKRIEEQIAEEISNYDEDYIREELYGKYNTDDDVYPANGSETIYEIFFDVYEKLTQDIPEIYTIGFKRGQIRSPEDMSNSFDKQQSIMDLFNEIDQLLGEYDFSWELEKKASVLMTMLEYAVGGYRGEIEQGAQHALEVIRGTSLTKDQALAIGEYEHYEDEIE